MMPKLYIFLFAALVFMSCSPTTSIKVLKPAAIYIPDHIQVIGTLDRSMPESGFKNIMEGIFSGEEIGQDKRGRRAAIQGFSKVLSQTPRFTIKPVQTELTGSKDGASMTAPLDWSEVDKLCKSYQLDALATLEMFDSDQIFRRTTNNEKYKDKNNKELTRTRYNIERRMEIRTGFRIYDNINKVVIDEHVTSAFDEDSGNGLSDSEASNSLRNVYDQVQEAGVQSGGIYARRIAPLYETLSRSFKRKVPTNKDAHEKALVAVKKKDWKQASEIWHTMATTSSNTKTKANACYNLAIVYEAQGELQLAAEWAEKSFASYGLKAGKTYLEIIKQRIEDNERLKVQMRSRNKT